MPTKTISVSVYKTPEGDPTCCRSVNGQQCEFLGTRLLGTREVCMLGEQVALRRQDGGSGYIIPHKKCRLHYASSDS